MKRFLILLFLLPLMVAAQEPVNEANPLAGLSRLPVATPQGKKLPSWLNSDYAPIFNGISQYASAPILASSFPSAGMARTIMLWQRNHIYSTNGKFIFGYGPDVAGNAFGMLKTAIAAGIYVGGNSALNCVTFSKVGDYEWHHYAFVLPASGNMASIAGYLDGVQQTMVASTGTVIPINTLLNATGPITFCTYPAATAPGAGYYAGIYAAELSIWNRALDVNEINRYMPKRLKGTETGLVALYHLDEPQGALQLIDSVGGKNADVYGHGFNPGTRKTPYYSDIRDEKYALYFDGTDDFASGPWNGAAATWPMTLEYWTYISSASTGTTGWANAQIAEIPAVASSNYTALTINTYGGTTATCPLFVSLYDYLNTGSSANRSANSTHATRTGWHHHAATLAANGEVKAYLNGQVVSSSASTVFTPLNTLGHILLASRLVVSGSLQVTKGKMCSVRIWDTARTQEQIRANMFTTLTGSEAGLRHYYKVNEGAGTTLYDSVATDPSNLTLYNSPTWVGRGLTRDYETNPKSDKFCVSLDGVNDDLRSVILASSTWEAYSFGGWFSRPSVATASATLRGVVGLYGASVEQMLCFRENDNSLWLRISSPSVAYCYYAMPTTWSGWKHIVVNNVVSATGTISGLFVDGEPVTVTTATTTSGIVNDAYYFFLGRCLTTTGYFNGCAADVFLYKKTLTQSEIQSLMTTRPSDYSDSTLVGYWPMNEGGRSNTSFDYSTSSLAGQYFQNLIHINGPTWTTRSIP